MNMKKGQPIKKPMSNVFKLVPKWGQVSVATLLISSMCPIDVLGATNISELFPAVTMIDRQQTVYTGTVKDANGNLLQGVTISVKGQTKALTSTDANGRFVAEVPSDATLVFKLVGFEFLEVPLTENEKDITVTLNEDLAGIDEVVVVGFGTQKKESNVGSQATIKREELKVPVANLTTAIAGRLAGVVATQRSGGPGSGGANLFVRGVSTFASSPQSPLLIF